MNFIMNICTIGAEPATSGRDSCEHSTLGICGLTMIICLINIDIVMCMISRDVTMPFGIFSSYGKYTQ